MGGIGSIFAAVFGVIWTVAAASMGAPVMFSLFGVIFIIMALVQGAYHWKNATSGERFSEYDIVDSKEEGDPLNRIVAGEKDKRKAVGGEVHRPEEEAAAIWNTVTDRESAADRNSAANRESAADRRVRFCPYCGTPVEEDFEFCGSCGKELPDRK